MSNATIGRSLARLDRRLLGKTGFTLLAWLALVALLATAAAGCATPGASAPNDGTPPAALAGHPLLGTWSTDITKADLAAGGLADPGARNENSGRFLWTLAADGTWTQVQQSLDGAPINNPVFRGTFVVDGDQLIMTTTFPEQYRDSGLHYTWTIEGDEVRFDLLDPPDPVLPLVVETHPWKRAG